MKPLAAVSLLMAAAAGCARTSQAPAEPRQRVIMILGRGRGGPVPYAEGMTVAEAIEAAGGVREKCEPAQIHIMRGSKTLSPSTVSEALDLQLQADDAVLVLPWARVVSMYGRSLANVGLFPYTKGMTVAEAIEAAGGLVLKYGEPKIFRIKRGETVIRFSTLSDMLEYRLRPDDLVLVERPCY